MSTIIQKPPYLVLLYSLWCSTLFSNNLNTTIFLPFCSRKFSNVMTCGFCYERLIWRKKFFLLRLSQKDFIFFFIHPQKDFILYIKMGKKSNNSYFSRKNHFLSFCWRNFSKVITCSFHFEKNISHKKTLLIHTSQKDLSFI